MIRVMDSVEIIFDWIRDSSEIGDIKRFENLGTMNYYLFFKLTYFYYTLLPREKIKEFSLFVRFAFVSRSKFSTLILKYSHFCVEL